MDEKYSCLSGRHEYTKLVFKETMQIGKEDEGISYIQKSTNKSSEEGN